MLSRLALARGWLVLLAVLAAPAVVSGQVVEAAVVGAIRDTTGRGVPGAEVVVRNLATGGSWRVVAASDGRFAFMQLPLGGPYEVTARRLGLRPAAVGGITLGLSDRVTVDLRLQPGTPALAPVRVEGRESASAARNEGGNFAAGAAALAATPAVNRNFTDLVALAPTTGVQSSLLGQRWTSTDIRIDGFQARNLLRAGEFGAGPFTVSLEAIREFEVTGATYDVTLGRQGGGAIRAATRAGTNTWEGSTFTYYRSSALSAARDFQSRPRDARAFAAYQWGGSMGGPIVRDRAHLFVAFDRWDSDEPLFTGLAETPGDEVAAGVARDSLRRLVQVLGGTYGLDASRPVLGRLDRRPVANTLFGRLDWQLAARHRLTLTHDYSGWNSPLAGGVDQPIALIDARSDYRTDERLTLASLQSAIGSAFWNTLRIGLSSSARLLTPRSSAPRGFVRIQSELPNSTRGDIRVQFGGTRLAPDDSREWQLQLIDHVQFERGNVLWTVGTDNSLSRLTTSIGEAQSGLFEFNSLADLEARRAFRFSRTVPLREVLPTTRQGVLEVSGFVQAEWRPAAQVTATAGLRYDGSAFLNASGRNTLVEQVLGERTDLRPADWRNWQPRAQLRWTSRDGRRRVLRIGAGRFVAQAPYYMQHNQLLNDGARIADIVLTGALVPVPDFPSYRRDPSLVPGLGAGAVVPAPYVNLVDPGYRLPATWRGSASFTTQLAPRLAVTGTWLMSRTDDNYFYADRNLRDAPAFTLANEGQRPVFVPPATVDVAGRTLNVNARKHAELGRVLQLNSAGRARQRSAILELAATPWRGTEIQGSYTWNRALDNSTFGCCLARTATTFTAISGDPRTLAGAWGPSDTDFHHKVVVMGRSSLPWGLHAGLRYVGANGRPFSAVVNGDINGDESSGNDLAFVFDPDDPATPPAVAASMRRVLANPDNVARQYLRANLGRIATRNGVRAPSTHRIDLRLARRFATVRRQHAEVGLDVFNVANLLNRRWGGEYLLPAGISNQNPVVQRVPLLNVVGFDQAARRYVYEVNENFGVLQKGGVPYQLQLAVRYGF